MHRVVAGILLLVFVKAALLLQDAAPTRTTQHTDERDAGASTMPVGPRDISDLLKPIVEKHDVPGLAAIVLHGDRLVMHGVAGVRKKGSPEAITLGDKFHLGSCTKAMTATLCAILVEEGKLRWDTTLLEVFPDAFKEGSGAKDVWRNVTLEQLLTNRGGAPADLSADGLWIRLVYFKGSPVEARRALLEGVLKRDPDAPPGTKYVYSNQNFAIAGHMAETVTGKPWEDLITEKLFTPLKITSAGFGAPGTPGAIDQPRGHNAMGGGVEPGRGADNPEAISPAGRVHMTLEDWGRFISLHLKGAQAPMREPGDDDAKGLLLPPSVFRKLHTPVVAEGDDYAFGWVTTRRPWAGDPGHDAVLAHSGSNTMWMCCVWMAPEKNFAVLVACNRGGTQGAKACDEAAAKLIGEYLKPQ